MISIQEPLDMLRKLSLTHNDEVPMATLTYRSGIINLDKVAFEKAVAAANFNLDERKKAEDILHFFTFTIAITPYGKILEKGKSVFEFLLFKY